MVRFSISNDPDQKFSVILNNRRVTFRFRYNPTTDRWSFDVYMDDLPVLQGRRVTMGTDLLASFDFDIGHLFAYPTVDGNLPNRTGLPEGLVNIYHISAEEAEALIA